MARNFQLAFWLCVLLLNEFGPANMVRLDAGKHIGKSAVHDKGYKLKKEYQKELQSVNEKEEGKSVIAVIAKAVYKGFKIGAVVIPKLISLASFGNAVFRAIAGCCLDFPEACEGNDKIAKLQEEMREKSLNIDALQLEAQNLQEWTESSRHKFSLLVSGMATIIDNTDVLVRSVSPQAIIAVNNQTVVIKKLVREKEKIGEKVDLDTVESMYGDAVGSFLDITLPIFELILPTLPKVIKFAAEKFAVRKAQQLNDILKNGLKTPPPNSIKAVRAKGWFAKTKAKINTKIKSIKLRIKAKYSNAVSILSKVGKGLSFLFDTLTSGYELYSIIDSALTCKAKRDNVLESLKELKSASKELDDIYYKVKRSKMVIEKAWSTMHRQISSKALTRDLKEMQKILATISEPSSNVKYISSGIDVYITKIAQTTKSTSPDDIYQLLDDLTTVMGQVPFTIDCFDNKVQMVNYIWEECRRGTDTFNNLYQQGIELFDERAKLCKGKIGILHMDRKSIKKTLSEKARTFNFNEDCILNSELKKGYVCQLKDSGYSLGEVAEKAKLTKNQVEFLTKQCPKAEITPTLQNAICNLKKLGLSDVKVADALKLDVNDVRSVKC